MRIIETTLNGVHCKLGIADDSYSSPWIVGLHPNPSTAARFAKMTNILDLGTQHGHNVLIPESPRRSLLGRRWNPERDAELVSEVLSEVLARHGGATSEVAAVGMSAGAALAVTLAARDDRIVRCHLVAGLHEPPTSPDRTADWDLTVVQGLKDQLVPVTGPDDAVIHRWSAFLGCESPAITAKSPRHQVLELNGTRGRMRITLVKDGGHNWPGGTYGPLEKVLLRPFAPDIDAGEAFFQDWSRS